MKESLQQFPDVKNMELSPKDLRVIETFKRIYLNQYPEEVAQVHIANFWEEYKLEVRNFLFALSTAEGEKKQRLERNYLEFIFRTAKVLALSGYSLDALELLRDVKISIQDALRAGQYVPASDVEMMMGRIKNAIAYYEEEVVPQLIRDVDFTEVKMGGPTKEFGKIRIYHRV